MRSSWLALWMLAACAEGYEPADPRLGPGSAARVWVAPTTGARIEAFDAGTGATTPVTDFLFVVDPSVSMDAVLDRVRAGFASLADEDVWPAKARIAVTSMVPAVPKGRAWAPDPAVKPLGWTRIMPGFHGLVDADGIARFRTQAPSVVGEAFTSPGCEAWFAPGDRDPAGTPCLEAHTRLVLAPFGVEAGLTALAAMVVDPSALSFRPGAAVNVVFVSDTHDPGKPGGPNRPAVERLVAHVPVAADLATAIAARTPVTAVRFHAIAPATPCVERWSDAGATYARAVEATGGRFLDVCTASDYAPFIRDIARDGAALDAPLLRLGAPAERVDEVTLDGVPTAWTSRADDVIEVPAARGGPRREVEVRYQPRAASDRVVSEPDGARPRRGLPGSGTAAGDARAAPVGEGIRPEATPAPAPDPSPAPRRRPGRASQHR